MKPYLHLFLLPLFLFGCGKQTTSINQDSVIMSADAQRRSVISATRAGTYVVFPDVPRVEMLEDDTYMRALRATRPNGTAFAVRSDGIIFTNAHVVKATNFCTAPLHPEGSAREAGTSATYCLLATPEVTKVFRAKLIKMDEVNDIAALKIEQTGSDFTVLQIAGAGSFNEGAEIMTLGAPLGNANFTTFGFISNLKFKIMDEHGERKGATKLQFNAAILPGNSGGALVSTATGKVVGQVVAVVGNERGTTFTQMSYANPADKLQDFLSTIPRE